MNTLPINKVGCITLNAALEPDVFVVNVCVCAPLELIVIPVVDELIFDQV